MSLPPRTNHRVTYLVGDGRLTRDPMLPFDATVCEFLEALSKELMSSTPTERDSFPDVVAFAFWCRKANLEKMKAEQGEARVRLGVGLVFHIAPANVPVNFAFSLAFGLLSGNANRVRVSSRTFPQVEKICGAIQTVLKRENFKTLREKIAIMRYEPDEKTTRDFSAEAAGRVVWGGNDTIQEMRKFPLSDRGREVTFADRFSFCVIEASAILPLDELGLKRLAQAFYNDTYLMDQDACSSPHFVWWIGKDTEASKEKFWGAVAAVVEKKYKMESVKAVEKFTHLCEDAIQNDGIRVIRHGNAVYRVQWDELPNGLDAFRGRYGYFYEGFGPDISSIKWFVNTKYQTLTYFGLDKSTLQKFVIENRLNGIDRIDPVGMALDMGVNWDGYDIVKSLSRIIDVK